MQIARITPDQAREIMQSHNRVIFDVRPDKKMYDEGHIKGAISYPVDTVDELTANTRISAKDTPVIVYCRTGANAEKVAERLMGYGYQNIYCLGALTDWPYEIVQD